MSTDPDPLLLVCGADENYARPLAVTLYSALLNLDEGPVRLYVVDGGIRPESKRRLESVVESSPPRVDLQWARADMSLVEDLPTYEWINTTTYLRLLIPEIVPDHFGKALYLDSDLQVEASLSALWTEDLDGHPLAAVQAYGTPYVSFPLGIQKYEDFGLPPDTPYFNAGILLLDLDQWRRDDIAQQVFTYLRDYRESVQMTDQDGLNAVLATDWKPLDLSWNVMSHLLRFERWPDSRFKERVAPRRTQLLTNPKIYHFAGETKPWHVESDHPAQFDWLRYLWTSGWFSPAERLRWFGRWIARYVWWRLRDRTRPLRHELARRSPPPISTMLMR
jgi:lipopolysaccharide biosynthesis glycosyltransferase